MNSYWSLERFGRIQLSKSFFVRDFLHSEIGAFHGIRNVPVDPDLMIYTGRKLCEAILEPLSETFGRIHIRSGYRSPTLNQFGHERGLNCASNRNSAAEHLWDLRDAGGHAGACASVVIPWFLNQRRPEDWPQLARWMHDHLEYDRLTFFAYQTAFNVSWRENPRREIRSYIAPLGRLNGKGAEGWSEHPIEHEGFPPFRGALTPLDEIPWKPSKGLQPVAPMRPVARAIVNSSQTLLPLDMGTDYRGRR